MSQELRYIVFTEAELAAALIAWERRHGRRVASAAVHRLAVRRVAGEIEADLLGAPDAGGPPLRITRRGSDLAGALIAFCGARGIPLPRRAPKRLALLDGRLMLMMSRNAQPADPRVIDGAVCYDDPLVATLAPRPAA